jgi:DNA-binding response OmpR family regulator
MAMTPKILIVEDDVATRVGLQELLRHAGYDAIAAGTFRDGRRALEEETPDLLIADLRLDGFNGLQLVLLNPRPIPAIIVTGFPDEVLQADARRLGAEYLVKPFSSSALLDMIKRLLAPAPQRAERRLSQRKRLVADMPMEIDTSPARLLDVSYGGLRFEMSGPAGLSVPPSLRLTFPARDLSVAVDVVWANRNRGGTWLCGAALVDEQNLEWRRLVDASA